MTTLTKTTAEASAIAALFAVPPDPPLPIRDLPPPPSPEPEILGGEGALKGVVKGYVREHPPRIDTRQFLNQCLARGEAIAGALIFTGLSDDDLYDVLVTSPPQAWIFIAEPDVAYLLARLGLRIVPRLFELQEAGKVEGEGLLRIRSKEAVRIAAVAAMFGEVSRSPSCFTQRSPTATPPGASRRASDCIG